MVRQSRDGTSNEPEHARDMRWDMRRYVGRSVSRYGAQAEDEGLDDRERSGLQKENGKTFLGTGAEQTIKDRILGGLFGDLDKRR